MNQSYQQNRFEHNTKKLSGTYYKMCIYKYTNQQQFGEGKKQKNWQHFGY